MVQGLVCRAEGKTSRAMSAFRRAAASLPHQPSDKPARLAQRIVILTAVGKRAEAQSLAQRLKSTGYRDPTYLRDLRSVT